MRGRRKKTEGERAGPDQGSTKAAKTWSSAQARGWGASHWLRPTSVLQLDFCLVTTPASATPDSTPSPDLASPSGDTAPPDIQRDRWLQFVVVQSLSRVPLFCDPMDCSMPGSSVHGISQQEDWSGLPFPSPGDLPKSGIEPPSPLSPVLAGGFFTTMPPGKPSYSLIAPNCSPSALKP